MSDPESKFRLVSRGVEVSGSLASAPNIVDYVVVATKDGSWPETTDDPERALVMKRDDALAWLHKAHALGSTSWGLEPA